MSAEASKRKQCPDQSGDEKSDTIEGPDAKRFRRVPRLYAPSALWMDGPNKIYPPASSEYRLWEWAVAHFADGDKSAVVRVRYETGEQQPTEWNSEIWAMPAFRPVFALYTLEQDGGHQAINLETGEYVDTKEFHPDVVGELIDDRSILVVVPRSLDLTTYCLPFEYGFAVGKQLTISLELVSGTPVEDSRLLSSGCKVSEIGVIEAARELKSGIQFEVLRDDQDWMHTFENEMDDDGAVAFVDSVIGYPSFPLDVVRLIVSGYCVTRRSARKRMVEWLRTA